MARVAGARGGYPNQHLSAPGCKEFTLLGGGPLRGNLGGIPKTTYNKQKEQVKPQAEKASAKQQCDTIYDPETGDLYTLCQHCRLPLGDVGYDAEEGGRHLHGECKAQLILRDAKKEEDARLKKDAALKKKRRAQYDLGWKAERVPRNLSRPAPQGMCGLVWQEESKSVCIVPTAEQAASVNLEYLSLALEVRRREGREPMFSLDPKDGLMGDKENHWQVKRFEPEWLAGTSVGEVMFQADYHLKELSMGEYAQPVIGMKSCFDFSAEEGIENNGWNAREWFVVNKAEMLLTEDRLMLPTVQMGVEARETVRGEHGLEDLPLTRPDHPLVKYAESFTQNFELIAARKSSIFHLRELAKASVTAKFLMENECPLEESWFSVAGEAELDAHPEIPQLWNEHAMGQIHVADGRIVDSENGAGRRMFGVYGGVELGLDRIGRVGARVAPGRVGAAKVPSLTARMVSARGAVAEFPVLAPGVPKGVDLNLDRFELSAPGDAVAEGPAASWGRKEFLGNAFWSNLSSMPEHESSLLKDIFHPALSDRRDDGELFTPPDTSAASVELLRELVKQEAAVRSDRMSSFLSQDFAIEDTDGLFPASWQDGAQLTRRGELHPRVDYDSEAYRLIKSATPVFDKSVEDNTRFRIYQVGTLEVRTTQEHNCDETVRAVFTSRAQGQTSADDSKFSTVAKNDKIVKAVEYVEKAGPSSHRFYVVFETDHGDVIVTEKMPDQTIAWTENPEGIEYRNSVAKVLRASDAVCATVQDMKAFHTAEMSRDACQGYAHNAFLRALPAKDKTWSALADHERKAAKQLGVHGATGWDQAAAQVWKCSWQTLDGRQLEAAQALGYCEATWGAAARAEERRKIEQAERWLEANKQTVTASWP